MSAPHAAPRPDGERDPRTGRFLPGHALLSGAGVTHANIEYARQRQAIARAIMGSNVAAEVAELLDALRRRKPRHNYLSASGE